MSVLVRMLVRVSGELLNLSSAPPVAATGPLAIVTLWCRLLLHRWRGALRRLATGHLLARLVAYGDQESRDVLAVLAGFLKCGARAM